MDTLRVPYRRIALRIVSLAPSCTSILCALGASKNLAAVTPWCAGVAPVRHLPAIGDCWRLEALEKIARLRPTLIVGSVPFHAETVARILTVPAQFLALNPRTLADIQSDIQTLARLTNRIAKGRQLMRRMNNAFAKIRRQVPQFSRRPRIYSEAWPNPRISSPPWVSELISLCGGKMVVAPGRKVADQEVADARPDIILLAWTATGRRANPKNTLAHPRWQAVPAVLHKRVFVVRDDLLNTPGPPLIAGALQISRILEPLADSIE
jgi:iron complex transport system substrate-binding protein